MRDDALEGAKFANEIISPIFEWLETYTNYSNVMPTVGELTNVNRPYTEVLLYFLLGYYLRSRVSTNAKWSNGKLGLDNLWREGCFMG